MKTFLPLFLLTLLLASASCKKSEVAGNQNADGGNASTTAGGTSSTPPFATKEPERYQATRFVTTNEGGETTVEGGARIARDGERRREDYEMSEGRSFSYLQLPEGIYLLLHAKKLYAEVKPETGGLRDDREVNIPPDFSTDKLLNEMRPESRYEKLGAESLNGRATTKYRVIVKGNIGEAKEYTTESLAWVDDSLGLPVKSETTSTSGTGSRMTITVELRDIKETVDAGMFELPPDYRKVEAGELFMRLNQGNAQGKGRE